jgi:diguanylate cyclase (GGDEF)-like protein/PAS domain S-box-containing protein
MPPPPPIVVTPIPAGVAAQSFDSRLCESEPIHTPGAIQDHGALLAVRLDSLRISHASANLAAILGHAPQAALGRTLDEVIGTAAAQALLGGGDPAEVGAERVQLLAAAGGGSLYLRARRCGQHVCVDIEPMHFEPHDRLPIIQAQAVLKSFEQASSALEVCQSAVRGLQSITGYDRVMAYRFADGGDGEVIAEAREPHLEPFLGLRYPAADVPPQARQLYLRQRVGSVADSSATPVPLLTDPALDDGTPLDLSFSALRSASPVHREYMRNMHTGASLTVGLVLGGNLWGMLVCHQTAPRVAGPELRAAAGTIGQVVSLLLESLGDSEVLSQRLLRNVVLRSVVDHLAGGHPLAQGLLAAQNDLLYLMGASGALIRVGGDQAMAGHCPPAATCAQVHDAMAGLAGKHVLALDDLGVRWPALDGGSSDFAGALLLPLGSDGSILWFRPELARTITWGGNPAAHASVDPVTARISPRSSFQAWKETVRGRSAPWTDVDLTLAVELRTAVQAELARRTILALRASEAKLGLLAEHSGVVVALCDLDGTRTYVSPAAERVLGWRPEDLVGRRAADFVHPDDLQGVQDALATLTGPGGQCSVTYRLRRPDGSWLWVDDQARLRVDPHGQPAQDYIVVLRDATERKAAETLLRDALDRMERMAATDGLTGLANRRQLDLTIDREWRRCARERLPLSAMLLDADRFKRFNDHYGHLAGDDCLRAIAARIQALAQRPGDVAARYGGEEFMLLLPGTDAAGALCVADRLRASIEQLALDHVGNAGFGVVTVSIGSATAWPGQPGSLAASVPDLIGAADAALYRAKSGGRNRVEAAPVPRQD